MSKVIVRKRLVQEKPKVIERIRMKNLPPKPKPYEGLVPGTPEWMECWKSNKGLQQEMLHYKARNFTEDENGQIILGTKEQKEMERRRELKQQEEFMKLHGIGKTRSDVNGTQEVILRKRLKIKRKPEEGTVEKKIILKKKVKAEGQKEKVSNKKNLIAELEELLYAMSDKIDKLKKEVM